LLDIMQYMVFNISNRRI